MALYELLKLIQHDEFPLHAYEYGIDSIPNTLFTVTLCFMSEEETWVTVNIANEILIPWYDCEVASIQGSSAGKRDNIEVWLKSTEYIETNWAKYINLGDKK